MRAGLLLAGLAFEIGYPILYDNFLNLGAVIPLGQGAMRKQFGSAPRVAFQCAIHQLLQEQLEPRCPLRSSAFAVCGGSILDLADDFTDKLAFAALGGRPLRLPETPFLNRECSGGLRRPDLLIARTSHIVSGEIPGVIAIRECDLDRAVCNLGSKFLTPDIDGPRSAITRDPLAPKLLKNGLQCRHPFGLAVSGDVYWRQQQIVDHLEEAGRTGR